MYRCAKGHERRENCELELESFVSIYAGALLARRLSISDVVYAAEKRGERERIEGKKRGLRNYRRDSKRRPAYIRKLFSAIGRSIRFQVHFITRRREGKKRFF